MHCTSEKSKFSVKYKKKYIEILNSELQIFLIICILKSDKIVSTPREQRMVLKSSDLFYTFADVTKNKKIIASVTQYFNSL